MLVFNESFEDKKLESQMNDKQLFLESPLASLDVKAETI